jgi:Mg-chelatase subunit ChlD
MTTLSQAAVGCNRHGSLLGSLVVCSLFIPLTFACAQSSEIDFGPTYRRDVSEVRLAFVATDQHDQPVSDLKPQDFVVVDDEHIVRKFRSFVDASVIKLDLTVLVDCSDSVLPKFDREMRSVMKLLEQTPATSGYNLSISIFTFRGLEARAMCRDDCRTVFTPDRIITLPRGGATPLFDAIRLATDSILHSSRPDAAQVAVLFSDGQDTISLASFREVSRDLLSTGAQLYAVDVGDTRHPSAGTTTLKALADESGGRYIQFDKDASDILKMILGDTQAARIVTYEMPPSNAEFHSVRILPTRNLSLQFHSRQGYHRRYGDAY